MSRELKLIPLLRRVTQTRRPWVRAVEGMNLRLVVADIRADADGNEGTQAHPDAHKRMCLNTPPRWRRIRVCVRQRSLTTCLSSLTPGIPSPLPTAFAGAAKGLPISSSFSEVA